MGTNIDYRQVASELENERIKIIQSSNLDDIVTGIKQIIKYAKKMPAKDIGKGDQIGFLREEKKQKDIEYLEAIIERITNSFYGSAEGMYIDISLTISELIINLTHLPLSEIQD